MKIRFIDSRYNTLFYIEDGEEIRITYSDGSQVVRVCRRLGDYHTQIGREVFHICEFAECMERAGATVKPERSV